MGHHIPRRMPIRTVELDFTDDGYPGFHATGRLNVPLRVGDDMRSGEEQRARAAILAVFPAWDFVDEEGEPIPHSLEGIDGMPQDLLEAMFTRWSEALRQRAAVDPKAAASSSLISPDGQEAGEEALSLNSMPVS